MKKHILSAIRTLIINTLATTALSILFMCFSAVLQGFTLWGVNIPFEILLVNFLMHMGFYLIQKIEIRVPFLTYAVMFAYLIGLLIGFGFLFNWFHANAIWIICLVGLFVFVVGILIDTLKIGKDAEAINKRLKEIKEREGYNQDDEQ